MTLTRSRLLIFAAVALTLVLTRWLIWQLTTGAARRRIIRENGCRPATHYQHQGVLGKLLGLDFILFRWKATKEQRANEATRLALFTQHKTLQVTALHQEVIFTIEPENIKTILSTKFNDFGLGRLRESCASPVFGKGIFVTDGHSWEQSRALIRPNFVRHQVADLTNFEQHVQNMFARIPQDRSSFDIQSLFFGLTMDSSTDFLFGKSTHTLVPEKAHKDAAKFAEAFDYATELMTEDFRSYGLNRFIPNKKRKESREIVRKFATDIVCDAMADRHANKLDSTSDYVFLHELLKATSDVKTIVDETLNVLLAGRDTTASLLSHTFYQLARRPDIWSKLQAEVAETLGDRTPDYETLKSMKYVKQVLNESLRLYPVVPINVRMALRDTFLPIGGGSDETSPVFVPAGTLILYSVWSMHRRVDLYGDDALEYKPERWEHLRAGWEFLPFNGGPRICIGQNFALTIASYTLVRLLQRFKQIEPRDDSPWLEKSGLTFAVGNGVHLAMF